MRLLCNLFFHAIAVQEEQHYEKVTRKGNDKKLKVSGRGTCEMHAALQNGHSLAELLLGELDKCSTIFTRGLFQWKTLDCHILHVVAKNTKVASIMLQLQTSRQTFVELADLRLEQPILHVKYLNHRSVCPTIRFCSFAIHNC
jgi:hypothetical protein